MRPELRKSMILAGLSLGIGLVTVQALGGPQAALKSSCSSQHGQRYVTASRDQLETLLSCDLDGATIALEPGDYGRLSLEDVKGLTLTSSDPSKPASFEAIEIKQGNRITLTQLHLGGSSVGVPYRLQVLHSTDVDAADLDLMGGADPGAVAPGGVYVRWSNRVSLKRLKVSSVLNGIQFLDSSQVTVSDNLIRDVRSDGVQGSAVSQLVISGNYISRAHPAPGDHPDGIQIFTIGNQTSASDIVIKDNLIERGSGGLTQGIFVTDGTGHTPFSNVQITNNIVIGSLYHGITVSGVNGGAVRGNLVVPLNGQKNWIMLVNADSLLLEDNVAQYLIKDKVFLQAGAGLGKNRRFITPEADAIATSNAWKAKHFPVELRDGN